MGSEGGRQGPPRIQEVTVPAIITRRYISAGQLDAVGRQLALIRDSAPTSTSARYGHST